ncbi:hypothetical protein BOX15_Mlig029407g1, partial [Macrostomum lignano]
QLKIQTSSYQELGLRMFSILLYLLLYVSSFLIGLAVIWYLTDKTNWIRYEDNSSESSESVSCSAEPHCTVCGNSNCYRPRSASTSSFPPYLNINFTVDEPVSDALFEFFELVIDRYILCWYKEISSREDFVNDVRLHLKYAVSALLHRCSRCDIGQFVEDQVIPGAVAHYQVCNDVLRRGNLGSTSNFESLMLRNMRGHLHVAMKDRTAEYDYVKGLVSKVLPHLLHPTAKGSKSLEMLLTEILTVAVLMPALDSLANPHTVNRLILEALDDFPLPQPSGQPVARVPVLHRYTEMAMAASKAEWQQQQQQPQQGLQPPSNIGSVYEHHGLRQAFIDFMKLCDSLELMIFYGDLEMINKDLVAAEIRDNTCQRIYSDIERIYESLLHHNKDIIAALQLPDEFMNCLRNVVKDGASSVPNLRTSSAWFIAHERVCNFLETHYLPAFANSDCYMKLVVLEESGSRDSGQGSAKANSLAPPQRQGRSRFFRQQQSAIVDGQAVRTAQHPSSLPPLLPAEEALEDSTLGGAAMLPSNDPATIASEYPEAASLADQLTRPPSSVLSASSRQRQQQQQQRRQSDMANWRVTVTGLGENSADDGQLSSGVMKYVIHVSCPAENGGDSWKVYRKYSEFYVLEEKLREFHGAALGDLPLQSKRLIGSSSREFLAGKRAELESFLRALLAKPLLRQSQLLRLFLSDQLQEFETSLLPDLSLNRLTSKFQRRGFFLAKDFLPGLLASTQAPTPEPLAPRGGTGGGVESLKQSRLHNYLFWNNAALSPDQSPSLTAPCPVSVPRVFGIYDLALFLLERVVFASVGGGSEDTPWWRRWLCHLLVGLRPLARPLIDRLIRNFINAKVLELTRDYRAVPIVQLFRDLIFFPERRVAPGDGDKQKRRADALAALKTACSSVYVSQALGADSAEATLSRLHDLLQYPRVNKQLLFTLVDPLLLRLFPELHQEAA